MSEFCPRCEAKVDQFGVCESGHRRSVDDVKPLDFLTHELSFEDCVGEFANGLRLHLRAAAREYLERLVRELGS